ncbi:MAG: ATP-binding cassette domain-containing protein [Verrucomicrobiota bacterium]
MLKSEATAPISDSSRLLSAHTLTLAQLVTITGGEYDMENARRAVLQAVHACDAEDPLAALTAAAAVLHLRVTPVRRPLSELVWQVAEDAPVVIWHEFKQRWVVITHAGWLRLRIADGEHPNHQITMTRAALARRLGVRDVGVAVEAGIVQSARPAQAMSAVALAGGEGGRQPNGYGKGHPQVSPVRRFFGLLKAERQDIRTLLIFSVFAGLLYLALPLAVDAVVSNLAFGGQQLPYVQALVILSIALFACLALQAVVTGFQYYVSDVIQRRIFVRAASDLAYRLPRVRAEALDEVHAPELVNRFLDVVTAQKSTALLLLDGVNLVFSTLTGMLLLALFHPLLLTFVAVMLVVIILILWLCGRGAVETSIEESRMKYDLVNWYEEIAHFPFLFKGPAGYSLAAQRADHLAAGYIDARTRHFSILMRQIAGLLTLQVFAAAALLVTGGYLVISQQITLGQLVASELIISAIVASLSKLGKQLEAWYDAMAAMDKLGHIFDLETEREGGERPAKCEGGTAVKAEGLSFGYLENVPLFTGQNFDVPPGARAAVVGPHGSGASSLLDILFGLRQPASGYVTVDGLDLRSWYLEALRESVMLVRRDEIVDGTVVENLRLGRTDIGMDEIRAALARTGLLDDLLLRPEGLNLRLKIGGAPLSGNQRTRLLLSRALVQKPRLLLVDELLDGVDESCFRQLCSAILDKSLPWTVVVTTRDHDVTRQCDQVIYLAPCHLTDGTDAKRLNAQGVT